MNDGAIRNVSLHSGGVRSLVMLHRLRLCSLIDRSKHFVNELPDIFNISICAKKIQNNVCLALNFVYTIV